MHAFCHDQDAARNKLLVWVEKKFDWFSRRGGGDGLRLRRPTLLSSLLSAISLRSRL